jgi:Domain of unknown function (DUF3883)
MDWSKTVFLHIGWTEHYDGSEKPESNHSYLKKNVGVEASNFLNLNGWCYGYAPVRSSKRKNLGKEINEGNRTLNITNLGAGKLDKEIAGVTVVWTATKPKHGAVIVGVYRNAIVRRHMPSGDSTDLYIAKARAEDCFLVSVSERTLDVPQRKPGTPGISAAWYPGKAKGIEADLFLPLAADYLNNLLSNQTASRLFSPRQPDLAKRLAVEHAGMDCVKAHYVALDYTVKDVSKDCFGWDLEATKDGKTLLLEAKGLSGSDVVFELTPNEYDKAKRRVPELRLCVVTNALDEAQRRLHIFEPTKNGWVSDKQTLNFEERIAARVSAMNG